MAGTRKKTASAKVKTTKVNKTSVAAPAVKTPELPTAPSVDGSSLTIADLQSLASVIDIAVRRGAFGAGEVTEVGAIFDKLSKFLAVIAAQKEVADAAEAGK